MFITWLLLRGARESSRANNVMVMIKLLALGALHRRRRHAPHAGQLRAVRAERVHGHPPGRRDRVLRLHRVRRDFDRRGGDPRSAAEPADRHPRRPRHLHGHLRDRRRRADRHGAVRAAGELGRPARVCAAGRRVPEGRLGRGARRGGVDGGRAARVPVRAAAHLLLDGARRPAAAVGRDAAPAHAHSGRDDAAHRAWWWRLRRSSATRPRRTT